MPGHFGGTNRPRVARQRVLDTHRKDPLHGAQGFGAQARHRRPGCRRPHGQVNPVLQQGLPGAPQHFLAHIHLHRRMDRQKVRHHGQDLVHRHQGVHRQPQARLPACGQCPGLIRQPVGGGQQLSAPIEQQAPHRCEHGPAPLPGEKGQTQALFLFLDTVGQGGGHPVQFLTGRGKAAPAINGIENFQ